MISRPQENATQIRGKVAYGSSFNISYNDTSRDYKIILKVPDSSIDVYKDNFLQVL